MRGARYVVAESSGYTMGVIGIVGGSRRHTVEVMVLDRGYCYKVVWSSLSTVIEYERRWPRYGRRGQRVADGRNFARATAMYWPLAKRRRYAADLAARLNAETAA